MPPPPRRVSRRHQNGQHAHQRNTAQRYLWYTAYNPMKVPITVTSMSIAAVTPPAGCPISNLDYSATTFSGSLVVPASGTNSVSVPISLIDTGTNQDSCENTTFNFVYAGTATYTEAHHDRGHVLVRASRA